MNKKTLYFLGLLIATYEMMILGALFFSLSVRRIFGEMAALLVFVASIFGGTILSDVALRPNGVEVGYLLGGLAVD